MKRIVVILGLTLLACGCGTNSIGRRTVNGEIYRVDRPWWDSRETFAPPEDCKSMLDLATYRFPEDTSAKPIPIPEPCLRSAENYVPKGDAINQKELAYFRATKSADARDRLQDKLLALSNRECDEHHSAIVGTNSGTNFGLATLTSLFSGAATGFAAESTKTALAAISTFFGATRSHLNETVYRQLFVGTILQAIEDDRQSVLLNIHDKRRYPVPETVDDPRTAGSVIQAVEETEPSTRLEVSKQKTTTTTPSADTLTETKLTKKTVTTTEVAPRLHYGIDEAIRDAEQYHDRCSFYQGLVRVAVTVQEASPCVAARQRRDQILDEITAMTVMTPTGDAAKAYDTKKASLMKELQKLETKVQSCIDTAQ